MNNLAFEPQHLMLHGNTFVPQAEMKKPFNLVIVLKRIEKAIKTYPKAAMFELYQKGYTTLFEQLISCIISIRTLDETTIPVF